MPGAAFRYGKLSSKNGGARPQLASDAIPGEFSLGALSGAVNWHEYAAQVGQVAEAYGAVRRQARKQEWD
jgi:hypothetical protein